MNPPSAQRPRGLYAITPDEPNTDRLISLVGEVLASRPALLQYRNKSASRALRETQSAALAVLCRAAGVPLIINDDGPLALSAGADGVHLGAQDDTLSAARQLLGPAAIIGVSCYADLALAERAVAGGASYIAFGSVFASSTKPHAPRAELDLLVEARRKFSVPVCAIGGIQLSNAALVIATGVDLLAVISGLFDTPEPRATAIRFGQLFDASPR